MFEEREPGKPNNWPWTIGLIIVISLFNICIFIVIRALLDSENEFDEPIIQGKLRDDLTQFLGFFSLTFCFGCWCCFCCAGHCMSWTSLCHSRSKNNLGEWWRNIIKHEHIQRNTIKHDGIEENYKMEDIQMNELSNDELDRRKAKYESENETKPATILNSPTRKSNDSEMSSYQTLQNSSIIAMKTPSDNRRTSIAVRGIDFVQVPVQMMTPSTIAILDKGHINAGYDHSPDITENTMLTASNNNTSSCSSSNI